MKKLYIAALITFIIVLALVNWQATNKPYNAPIFIPVLPYNLNMLHRLTYPLSCAFSQLTVPNAQSMICTGQKVIVVCSKTLIVTRVYQDVYDQHIKLGDLILVWGLPIGYNRTDNVVRTYWQDKSAVTNTLYSPNSEVKTLIYGIQETFAAWHGFTSK